MKVLQISREYPPHVYGGAGVHVEHLGRELAKLAAVCKCSVERFREEFEYLTETDPKPIVLVEDGAARPEPTGAATES